MAAAEQLYQWGYIYDAGHQKGIAHCFFLFRRQRKHQIVLIGQLQVSHHTAVAALDGGRGVGAYSMLSTGEGWTGNGLLSVGTVKRQVAPVPCPAALPQKRSRDSTGQNHLLHNYINEYY